MNRFGITGLALCLAWPLAGVAQQPAPQPPPSILSISSWQCPQSEIEKISQDYDTNTRPVEQELVNEGKLIGAGMYFHAWSDEWNVNYYRIAPSMEGLFAAVTEVGQRVAQRNPQAAGGPGPFAACTAHKDNIYFMGPTTMAAGTGGN